ncbi:MAG: hypothetical protein COV52_08535 [Gammaproteobacteria bacterium CG11_big_fil_rev_8_21_14_0_20_46_22]|nr:MAG: hypothetical protein COW05_01005 [Gammaproteobacteria bacterium CG12_big_fil_rev_8_21_14_0_65_46_12]PIR10539.1 MAG: hypothetical protein COV52_08535 [Gammaproteobacteria bacterium CG11_big_fil_rev_8_21_14_0_20_46_22]
MNKHELKQAIKTLRQQFIAGASFLRKQHVNKHGSELSLEHAHWFIVMGSENTGKSALLQRSELPYLLSRKHPEKTKRYEHNWWVTKEAVFIDTPSSYLSTKHKALWKHFVRLLKRYSFQKKLDGIVIVLSLDELKQNEQHKALLKTLSHRLQTIRNAFKQRIPLYFIINKIDRLEGFNDFFEDYHQHERQQMWGMHFNPNQALNRQANLEFKDLQQRLHTQFLSRLTQINHEKAHKLFQFCEQFAELSPCVSHFFTIATSKLRKYYQVQGLYFTAALAESHSTHLSLEALQKHYSERAKSYFIHDLLSNISCETSYARKIHNFHIMRNSVLTGLLIVLLSSFIFAYQASQREEKLQLVSAEIAQSQAPAPNTTNFDEINTIHKTLEGSRAFGAGDQLTEAVHTSHLHALRSEFLPPLLTLIKQGLQNNVSDIARYRVLKDYSLLSASKLDNDGFKQLLNTLSPLGPIPDLLKDTHEQKAFLQALSQHEISLPLKGVPLDATRNYFRSLPKAELAFILLASHQDFDTEMTVKFNKDPLTKGLFHYQGDNFSVPKLYTAQIANQWNNAFIAPFIQAAQNGNAVLGRLTPEGDEQSIASSMQKLYSANYNYYWSGFINSISFEQGKDLNSTLENITRLSGEHSALMSLLNLLDSNLPKTVTLNHELQTLKNFIKSKQANDLQTNLNALANSLSPIQTANDQNSAALAFVKQRFYNTESLDALEKLFNLAPALPKPLNDWIAPLITQCWQQLMQGAQQSISDQWQSNVLPFYQQSIANLYPFNPQANDKVSEAAFTHFFKPHGLLLKFYEDNMQPFINENSKDPSLKARDGVSLDFSNEALNQFKQAKKIQALYFNNHEHPSLHIGLQPGSQDGNIRDIALQLGRQAITFNAKNMMKMQYLDWPNNTDNAQASIGFVDVNGKQYRSNTQGFWGLLELMNTGQFTNISKHAWRVVFNQNNADVPELELKLHINSTENPLDIGRFSHFQAPDSLF